LSKEELLIQTFLEKFGAVKGVPLPDFEKRWIKTLLPARLVSFTSLVLKKTPPFAFFHAKSGIFYV
jgi:hypothetical protein